MAGDRRQRPFENPAANPELVPVRLSPVWLSSYLISKLDQQMLDRFKPWNGLVLILHGIGHVGKLRKTGIYR